MAGTEKNGRWLRLPTAWRKERGARRAGRAGRDVFLAAAEMTSEHGWTLAGRRGWLPDAEFDVREVAAHLGEPEDDAVAMGRLREGLQACVAEGLLERAEALHGWFIGGDWWERMLPDRTARYRKAKEREAAAVADGHGSCRDTADGASGARDGTASADHAAQPAATRHGNGRDGASNPPPAGAGEAAARDVTAVAAGHSNGRQVTAIAAYDPFRSDPEKDADTPLPPEGAGEPSSAAPVTAIAVTPPPDEGPPLTAVERAAAGVIAGAMERDELRCDEPQERAERTRLGRLSTNGPYDRRTEASRQLGELMVRERRLRHGAIELLRSGTAAARPLLERYRADPVVLDAITKASKVAGREARSIRTAGRAAAANGIGPRRRSDPAYSPSPMPARTPIDEAWIERELKAQASGPVGPDRTRALEHLAVVQRDETWWQLVHARYSVLGVPTDVDRTTTTRGVTLIAQEAPEDGVTREAKEILAVSEWWRFGHWYAVARGLIVRRERDRQKKVYPPSSTRHAVGA